jgi:hypothetical protein
MSESDKTKPSSTVESRAADFADRVIAAGGTINRSEYSPKPITVGFVSLTVLPLALLVITNVGLPLLAWLLQLSLRNFPLVTVQTGVAVLVILVGAGLYALRCRILWLYGASECWVGIAISVYFVNNLKLDSPEPWFSLLAALYIIVRGADNFHKSLKGTPLEARWNKIFFGVHPLPS